MINSPNDNSPDVPVCIELNELEHFFCSIGELPISTLTWFHGDYRKAECTLERRVRLVIEKNPWLTGRVQKQRGKTVLEYHNNPCTSDDWKLHDFFFVLNPESSPFARDTPIARLSSLCSDEKIIFSNGSKEPLFRVVIVPCHKNPDTNFALIVALSHFVGDGATFYRLHEMLCSMDDSVIVPLIAERIRTSSQQQQEVMGKEECSYMSSKGVVWNWKVGILRARMAPNKAEAHFSLVDDAKMKQAKLDAQKEKSGGDSSNDVVSFVSTNDVLTSWFLQTTGCSHGQMAINFRNRLEGHGNDHAGNYENVLFYRRQDSATPQLIRQSLSNLRRASFEQPMPGFWERVTSSIALVTNWSSFGKPNVVNDCQEELHLPLYDVTAATPFSYALLIIFRAGPSGLGLFYSGQRELVENLRSAPFLSDREVGGSPRT